MSSGLEALTSYGLKRCATFKIVDNQFSISVEDAGVVAFEKVIYAFVIDNEIVRIGSSKGVFRARLNAWQRDVSRALNGERSPTPDWEAQEWKGRLGDSYGLIYARQGTEVTTTIGTFRAYLDEESVLIGRHLPPLNRNKHR